MSKVLVIEVSDDFDLGTAIRAVEDAVGGFPEKVRVYGAIREDAEKVLDVFAIPGP